ncbi:MAG TPA: zinc-dependent peptidase [Chitinophagaceae bacterium]|nr:zinc-dependent peptidase [Chitinophagaceae bacterium]
MDTLLIIAIIVLILFAWLFISGRRRKLPRLKDLPGFYRKILADEVDFYNQLPPPEKTEFETRMLNFLSNVKITGINTPVEDIDRVLVASSAIIPIFGFPKWEYTNLNEVLLYPSHFNDAFQQQGPDRDTLGLVGSGSFHRIMILSKSSLREGFSNKAHTGNVGIHEFVHLIDKTDGAVDGIPEVFLNKQYTLPWVNRIQSEVNKILEGQSEINPYGTKDEGEFLAVVAEYFFKRPDLLQTNHPELYEILTTIFRQKPPSPVLPS